MDAWLMLPVFLMYFSLESHVSFGADTISINRSLSGDQTIVSAGGIFQLGFFRPGDSSHYYIGMWSYMVSQPKTVWVANREKPIRDIYSSVLKIFDGNLVLFDESQVPVWSTNVSSTNSSSVVAVLLDNGNLVLKNGGPNSSTILWQSFNHPTDTWMEGSKFSFNKRTNQSQRFTSWKSVDDPAPGLYSLELDPSQPNRMVAMWNRSLRYWSTVPWEERTKLRWLLLYNLTFSYVSNENEAYFIYSFADPFNIVGASIDVSGQIKGMLRNVYYSYSIYLCEVYAFCGAFGVCNDKSHQASQQFCDCLTGFQPTSPDEWNQQVYSQGCVRKAKLQCQCGSVFNERGDQFLESRNTTFPINSQNAVAKSIMECKSTCLKNCFCTAYAYDENNGCLIWIGDLLNLKQLGEDDPAVKTLYIRIADSVYSSPTPTNKIKGVIIGAFASGLVFLGLMMFMIMRSRRRKTIIATKPAEDSLQAFGYKDMQKATKNFSEKLGRGGFGSVFKGTLPDSSIVAVKKLEGINQGDKQFRTEVSTIGMINHVNLVRLRGFCSEGSRKLLLYDYMPKGSLEKHLFHGKDSELLDWKTRYQIALGAARGLAYLHEKCRDCIIHCDIKPENILLDADFCPKLADFGLAKLLGREFSRVLTSMRGTIGYLAPEWMSGLAITPKADVFSYGMMILELVSGRRNFDLSNDESYTFFPAEVARQLNEGSDVLSLLDRRLNENVDVQELYRICTVACWCIQDDDFHRPSMSQVVQILEGVLELSLPPIPRFLQACTNDQESIFFFTDSSLGTRQI